MTRLYLWFCRVLFVARGPWVRWAPGLPCALFCFEGGSLPIARTQSAPRECGYTSSRLKSKSKHYRRHCERKRSNPDYFGARIVWMVLAFTRLAHRGWRTLVEHPLAVGAVERKGRHVDFELLAGFADHLIAAGHETRRGRKRDAGGIFEALAGREHRLFADHAFALDVLPPARGVGDDPVPRLQLHGLVAIIGDDDGIGPEIAGLLRRRTFRHEVRFDGHFDLAVHVEVH